LRSLSEFKVDGITFEVDHDTPLQEGVIKSETHFPAFNWQPLLAMAGSVRTPSISCWKCSAAFCQARPILVVNIIVSVKLVGLSLTFDYTPLAMRSGAEVAKTDAGY